MSSFSLAKNLEKKRRWVIGIGILQIILGILAIAFVGVTTLFSVAFLGALLLSSGIFEIIYGIRNRDHGDLWFHLLFGALTAVCGFFIYVNPVANMVVLTVLIAALFIATGLVTFIGSVMERFGQWVWFAINGAISVVAGYLILTNPLESSVWLIGLLVGIQLISRGLAWGGLVWSLKPQTA